MKHRLLIVSLLLLLTACGGGRRKPFEKNFNTVMGPANSSLRGVNLGDDYSHVMDVENPDFLEYQDSSMIRYTVHYSDSEEYKIVYEFAGTAVSTIQMTAYLGQISDGERLVALFKKRFNDKYGFGEEEQGVLTWTKNGESVELTDDSELFGYGVVSLLVFLTPPAPPSQQPL